MPDKTPFAKLIQSIGQNDYEISRATGSARSTISSLRSGRNIQPAYSLGIRLIALSGIEVPGALIDLIEPKKPQSRTAKEDWDAAIAARKMANG